MNGRIDKLRRDIAEAITAKDQRIAELEAKLDEYELLHRCDCCDCLTEDAVDMGDNMQCPSCSALWKATARAQAAEAALERVRGYAKRCAMLRMEPTTAGLAVVLEEEGNE